MEDILITEEDLMPLTREEERAAEDQSMVRLILQDPFHAAMAEAGAQEFRIGRLNAQENGLAPKTRESVLRSSWPLTGASRLQKAKPSSWPY